MTENKKTDDFVTVLTFYYAHETAIIRGRLESEGIACNIIDELTVQVNPLYSNAIGGVKLQVKESDFDRAIEILKEGGYLTDSDLEKSVSKFISFFERNTSKIPFLKNVRFEIRVIIIVTIIVGLITSIFHFATLPTKEEILTKNSWCIEQIDYNNKIYVPQTERIFNISGGGLCDEKLTFKESGTLSMPGFNSNEVYGNWQLYGDSIKISNADNFSFVYNGTYHVELSEAGLVLKSNSTILNCKVERVYW